MLSDPRFHARAVVNRQVHAIQQNARANNAPFGFSGGALGDLVPFSDRGQLIPKAVKPRKPRKPRLEPNRGNVNYKLRGANASRIRDDTTEIRSTMPSRKYIRDRLVAEFFLHGLEGVPAEIFKIVEKIIKDLQTIQKHTNRPTPDPIYTTEYFPRRPRASRAVVAPVALVAPVAPERKGMSDATKKALAEGRERARLARAEKARLTKKRRDMNERALRYNKELLMQ